MHERWNTQQILRRLPWLAIAVCIGVVAASVLLWRLLDAREHAHVRRMMEFKSRSIKDRFATYMDARVRELDRLARRWEYWGEEFATEWESDARLYLDHHRDYRGIVVVNRALEPIWFAIENDFRSNDGGQLLKDARFQDAAKRARRYNQPAVSSSGSIADGALGFVACIPIEESGQPAGLVVGVFDARDLFDLLLREDVAAGYAVSMSTDADPVYVHAGQNDLRDTWGHAAEVEIGGATWRVRVWPSEQLLDEEQTALPLVVLMAGLLTAGLLGGKLHFARVASDRRKAAEAATRELAVRHRRSRGHGPLARRDQQAVQHRSAWRDYLART